MRGETHCAADRASLIFLGAPRFAPEKGHPAVVATGKPYHMTQNTSLKGLRGGEFIGLNNVEGDRYCKASGIGYTNHASITPQATRRGCSLSYRRQRHHHFNLRPERRLPMSENRHSRATNIMGHSGAAVPSLIGPPFETDPCSNRIAICNSRFARFLTAARAPFNHIFSQPAP